MLINICPVTYYFLSLLIHSLLTVQCPYIPNDILLFVVIVLHCTIGNHMLSLLFKTKKKTFCLQIIWMEKTLKNNK